MTRNILLPVLFLFVFGCGDTPAIDDEGGTDATTMQDTSKPDTGSKDGSTSDAGKDSADDGSMDMDAADDGGIIVVDGGGPDGSAPDGGQCLGANDCKLFSSYCSTDPCKCIPLGANDPSPQCMGMKISCFVDPCLNKSAFCNNGKCDVQ